MLPASSPAAPRPVTVAVREPCVLRDRLPAPPVVLDVIDLRVVNVVNPLSAHLARRVRLEQLPLQFQSEPPRLRPRVSHQRVQTPTPLLRTVADALHLVGRGGDVLHELLVV